MILTYVSYCNFSLFTHFSCYFRQISATFFCECGYLDHDRFTVVRWIESETCIGDPFFDIFQNRSIPRLDNDCLSIESGDGCDIFYRSDRPVRTDKNSFDDGWVRTSGLKLCKFILYVFLGFTKVYLKIVQHSEKYNYNTNVQIL